MLSLPGEITHANGWQFERVIITSKDKAPLVIKNLAAMGTVTP